MRLLAAAPPRCCKTAPHCASPLLSLLLTAPFRASVVLACAALHAACRGPARQPARQPASDLGGVSRQSAAYDAVNGLVV